MIVPRILGFIALACLVTAALLGHRVIRLDSGLRNAISAFTFCSIAGIATSYTRAPWIIWPLSFAMLGAMVFVVWTLRDQLRRKRS